MILVFDRYADIPIFRTVLGFFQKNFVVHDHSLTLLFFDQGLGGLAKAGEIGIQLRGFDANQLDAPHGAFGVVFLSEQRGREQQQEYSEPVELLHSDLLDFIGLKRREDHTLISSDSAKKK